MNLATTGETGKLWFITFLPPPSLIPYPIHPLTRCHLYFPLSQKKTDPRVGEFLWSRTRIRRRILTKLSIELLGNLLQKPPTKPRNNLCTKFPTTSPPTSFTNSFPKDSASLCAKLSQSVARRSYVDRITTQGRSSTTQSAAALFKEEANNSFQRRSYLRQGHSWRQPASAHLPLDRSVLALSGPSPLLRPVSASTDWSKKGGCQPPSLDRSGLALRGLRTKSGATWPRPFSRKALRPESQKKYI